MSNGKLRYPSEDDFYIVYKYKVVRSKRYQTTYISLLFARGVAVNYL